MANTEEKIKMLEKNTVTMKMFVYIANEMDLTK